MTDTRLISATPEGLAEAATLLRAGGLVAFPTETVYGLGADATNAGAVARLYAAKGRPRFNPLIAHVPDAATAMTLGAFDADARRLAEAFWPGPLTLVVPARGDGVCDLARAGLQTLALRVPDHALARSLLEAAGRPIVAPSANRSGRISPTDAAAVFDDLAGRIDALVDGGPCRHGIESTIVACLPEGPVLLRPGAIGRMAMAATLGREMTFGREFARKPRATPGEAPLAPGALASHYAPNAPVRLAAEDIKPGEALLTFAGRRLPGMGARTSVLDLSPSGTLVEAAANLYRHLRALDRPGVTAIAVVPLPTEELGEAIADRLARAAAPRPPPE